MKFQVGQQVVLVQLVRPFKVHETTVSYFGRKYFMVKDNRAKFHLDSGYEVTEYSANWRVFYSMAEYLEDKRRNELERLIRQRVTEWGGLNNLSLDQLERIWAILEEK